MAENDELNELTRSSSADEGSQARNGKEFEVVASLSEELEEERDGRREDRFLAVVVAVVVFDAWAFTNIENWSGPFVIGLIQIFGLLVFARRAKVEEVKQWLDKFVDAVRPDRNEK